MVCRWGTNLVFTMSYINELNEKFSEQFTTAANRVIHSLVNEYKVKYPFVSEIICSNGTVVVLDLDGKGLHKMNWEAFDKYRATDPERHEDEMLNEYQSLRSSAENDPLIEFLQVLNEHPMFENVQNIKLR